jgi:hypothetical protein
MMWYRVKIMFLNQKLKRMWLGAAKKVGEKLNSNSGSNIEVGW